MRVTQTMLKKSLGEKLVVHGPFPYIGRILIWPKFYKLLWVKKYQIEWLHGTRISRRSCLHMLLFFSQGPVNLGLSQKQLLPLHWVHSAGESRDSLEPSLCCCSGVNGFLVGLQSVSWVTCPGSRKTSAFTLSLPGLVLWKWVADPCYRGWKEWVQSSLANSSVPATYVSWREPCWRGAAVIYSPK